MAPDGHAAHAPLVVEVLHEALAVPRMGVDLHKVRRHIDRRLAVGQHHIWVSQGTRREGRARGAKGGQEARREQQVGWRKV